MSVQYIAGKDGKAEYAVVPIADFEALRARAMDHDDIRAALDSEDDEDLPWAVARRLIDGENPVRVWREHRGLSQVELAAAAGLTPSYVSQIESGRKSPTVEVYRALGTALGLMIDDLIPQPKADP
ncbi:helix-turn-helix transcriptional regulator [Azospirillum sp.]|uniref:helix-turn-helix domain-containing protein n=1 Tax=Azospirillum sp. TaxID=34012 RepID=UPI002D30DEAA|nr:helix-turn-helix transcriptional regulator [Azospirillum sp.]HYF86228.1 helix-turn-helix transcriptional regulator [Azospirillum sp.]